MNQFIRRKMVKAIGWLCVVGAVASLIVSLVMHLRTREFLNSATKTNGTVVGLIEKHDSGSRNLFYPVFEYRDSNDKKHEIHSNLGTYPPRHKVGQEVDVLYLADQPEQASLGGFLDLWFAPLVCGSMGVFQLILALVILIVAPAIRPSQNQALNDKTSCD